MSPKDFLQAELLNIKETLEEALRFDYGPSGSKRFFEECRLRQAELEKYFAKTPGSSHREIERLADAISDFSSLLYSIERANETEVSWPFVEATKRLAEGFLKEQGPKADNSSTPLFLARAAGGLDSYSISPQDSTQNPIAEAPIHIIEFPRTLKHYVLIHPIFAHEIGHAVWSTPQFKSALDHGIADQIRSSGPLSSDKNLTNWMLTASDRAPNKKTRALMLESWVEEIFSDLFGLYCFGPSYSWAFKSIVFALDPAGIQPTADHPPPWVRASILDIAWKQLGWSVPKMYAKAPTKSASKFALGPFSGHTGPPWTKTLLTRAQIQSVLSAISSLPANGVQFAYPAVDPILFSSLVSKVLNGIPPCGAGGFVSRDTPELKRIDFRNILAAGWFAWNVPMHRDSTLDQSSHFRQINQLCEMGIGQQLAIDHFLNGKGNSA